MASLSSPESPAPRRKTVNINRVEKPSEEHEELEKMAHDAVEETRRSEVHTIFFRYDFIIRS